MTTHDEDHDDIDVLMDTDVIELGRRCRRAEADLAEALRLLRLVVHPNVRAFGAEEQMDTRALLARHTEADRG